MKDRTGRIFLLSAVVLGAVYMSGCALLSPVGMMKDYFVKLKLSIAQQEDPELVRQGLPTLILLIDAAVAEDPDNPDLLRTASNIYATYAQAFVMSSDNKERAAVLYGRAKKYAMRLLRQYDFFNETVDGSFDEYEKAILKFKKSDVPNIYTAASAWLGWIMSNSDSMEAMSELPKALALMKRVLDLDDTYADGGAHLVFGVYYAVQPPGVGRDLKRSKEHFESAMKLAGDRNMMPYVAYAEFYAPAAEDVKLFDKTLEKVLDSTENKDKQYALINAVARERAKALLDRREDLFDVP